MAQVVGYYENDVTFTDGPFVMVGVSGWRIECQVVGNNCPALPHNTIFYLLKSWGHEGKMNQETAEKVCDRLNELVRQGDIVVCDHWWVKGKDLSFIRNGVRHRVKP